MHRSSSFESLTYETQTYIEGESSPFHILWTRLPIPANDKWTTELLLLARMVLCLPLLPIYPAVLFPWHMRPSSRTDREPRIERGHSYRSRPYQTAAAAAGGTELDLISS